MDKNSKPQPLTDDHGAAIPRALREEGIEAVVSYLHREDVSLEARIVVARYLQWTEEIRNDVRFQKWVIENHDSTNYHFIAPEMLAALDTEVRDAWFRSEKFTAETLGYILRSHTLTEGGRTDLIVSCLENNTLKVEGIALLLSLEESNRALRKNGSGSGNCDFNFDSFAEALEKSEYGIPVDVPFDWLKETFAAPAN